MSGQAQAATGNPMIPQHPGIQQQRNDAGAVAQPQTAQPSQPQTPPADIDWFGLAMEMENEGSPENPQQPAQAPQSGQPPQGQPAQAGQQQEPLSAETRLAIAEAQGQPVQQPQQGAPQQQMTAEQAVQQATQHLLNTTYKLNDEQKRKLISEPDVAIPQLAAQMHVTIATQIGQFMQQAMTTLVPQLALDTMKKQMGAFRAEQAFFGQYPALNRQEFKPVVLQMLKYAKQLNPNADRATVMKEAAEMAAWKLRVQLTPQQQQPQAPARANGHAAAPQAPMPQMPYTPAQAGGASAQQAQPMADANIFEQLASDTDW